MSNDGWKVEFADPSAKYRGQPFWSWNGKLDKDIIKEQIDSFSEMGYGGFHIHSRVGLADEYLGDKFMDCVKYAHDYASEKKMLVDLYDEDKWPSGAGGGRVTKTEAYRARCLLLSKKKYPDGTHIIGRKQHSRLTENGITRFLSAYSVLLDKNGYLTSYKRVSADDPYANYFAYEILTDKLPWFNETGNKYAIEFSIMKDEVTLTIDTSGAGLHKRGYRLKANDAPIKETLAASLCTLARLRPYHTLYDPMCGSGTILIEGAMKALNMAPGISRTFAAEKFSQIDPKVWAEERTRAQDLINFDCEFHAYGSDIDANAIELAKENARRAGVEKRIDFEVLDLKDWERKSEKGTVICNPPYGERLLDINAANDLYKLMGQKFQSERGWAYYAISPSEEFEKYFGKKADKRRKLYNGMIKCQVYMYFK